MERTNLKDTNVLQFKKSGRVFYGGTQDFYPRMIQRWSGCGPTTAANLFAYLGLSNDEYKGVFPYDNVEYNTILDFMQTVWKFITPGMGGVNSTEIFKKGATSFLKDNKINLTPVAFDIDRTKINEKTLESVGGFIKKSLDNGVPVAFLNLDNGRVNNLQKWHWVLIVGISSKDGLEAVIYDEGDRLVIDLALWIKTVRTNGGFVSFEKSS